MNLRHLSSRPHGVSLAGVLVSALCLLALSACNFSLPQAQNDPTKFYVLAAPGTGAATVPAADAPVIRLRPVEIASYLQSRPMVVRRGENEVEFREFARWGEPLEQGIARVLREELLSRGAASAVQIGTIRPSDLLAAKYELRVRVLACEGTTEGNVNFHAVWELTTTVDNPTVVARGDYRPAALRYTTRNDASLAAALSRAVAGLAGDIAGGIQKVK